MGIGMESWHQVCTSTDVSEGHPYGCRIGGKDIGVFRTAAGCFAISNVCTHEVAFLSEGWQEGDEIECPIHQPRFRVTDGKCVAGPAKTDLETFLVREEAGVVYVRFDPRTEE